MPISASLLAPIRALITLLIAAVVLGCTGAAPGSPAASAGASPRTTPATGSIASPAPASPSSGLCSLFTPAELAPFLGAQPAAGSGGGPLDSACEWDTGDSFLMVQKVPADFFEDHRGAKGYRELDKIGEYAFVAGHPFGRITSARTSDAAYIVLASEGTDEAAQIDILHRFIERSPGPAVLDATDVAPATVPPASPGSGNTTDCAVSSEEVSQAAGVEVAQGEGCAWVAADAATLFEVLLTDVPTTLFEHLREQEPIDGLGDEAYVDTGVVYVRVGARAFSIQLITFTLSEQDALDVAIAIARRAVDRLR